MRSLSILHVLILVLTVGWPSALVHAQERIPSTTAGLVQVKAGGVTDGGHGSNNNSNSTTKPIKGSSPSSSSSHSKPPTITATTSPSSPSPSPSLSHSTTTGFSTVPSSVVVPRIEILFYNAIGDHIPSLPLSDSSPPPGLEFGNHGAVIVVGGGGQGTGAGAGMNPDEDGIDDQFVDHLKKRVVLSFPPTATTTTTALHPTGHSATSTHEETKPTTTSTGHGTNNGTEHSGNKDETSTLTEPILYALHDCITVPQGASAFASSSNISILAVFADGACSVYSYSVLGYLASLHGARSIQWTRNQSISTGELINMGQTFTDPISSPEETSEEKVNHTKLVIILGSALGLFTIFLGGYMFWHDRRYDGRKHRRALEDQELERAEQAEAAAAVRRRKENEEKARRRKSGSGDSGSGGMNGRPSLESIETVLEIEQRQQRNSLYLQGHGRNDSQGSTAPMLLG